MAAFLSDDWLAEAGRLLAELEPVGEASATIQYVVSGAPEGKVTVGVVIESGRVESVTPGKPTDPDITVSVSADEASAIIAGDTAVDVSYMRGAMKVEGAHAMWLLDLRDLRARAVSTLAELVV